MTDPKQSAFLAEYKALCERHGLLLLPECFDVMVVEELDDADPLDHVAEALIDPTMPHAQLQLYAGTPESRQLVMTLDMPPDFSQAFPNDR